MAGSAEGSLGCGGRGKGGTTWGALLEKAGRREGCGAVRASLEGRRCGLGGGLRRLLGKCRSHAWLCLSAGRARWEAAQEGTEHPAPVPTQHLATRESNRKPRVINPGVTSPSCPCPVQVQLTPSRPHCPLPVDGVLLAARTPPWAVTVDHPLVLASTTVAVPPLFQEAAWSARDHTAW